MPADPAARLPRATTGPVGEDADRPSSPDTARPGIGIPSSPGNLLMTVPEGASLLRVGVRTVWRLMADPDSGFPEPRRIRGRTLLVRSELLAFLEVETPP